MWTCDSREIPAVEEEGEEGVGRRGRGRGRGRSGASHIAGASKKAAKAKGKKAQMPSRLVVSCPAAYENETAAAPLLLSGGHGPFRSPSLLSTAARNYSIIFFVTLSSECGGSRKVVVAGCTGAVIPFVRATELLLLFCGECNRNFFFCEECSRIINSAPLLGGEAAHR